MYRLSTRHAAPFGVVQTGRTPPRLQLHLLCTVNRIRNSSFDLYVTANRWGPALKRTVHVLIQITVSVCSPVEIPTESAVTCIDFLLVLLLLATS